MLSSVRKLLSRSVVGSSLAGDGLLVRLRSTSIALLGVIAAVGLGLIAFISQLGWPGVLNAPIPGPSAKVGTVRDAIALTQPSRSGTPVGPSVAAAAPARATLVTREHPKPRGVGGSAVGGSHQLGGGAQPPAPASNTPPVPTSTPTPEPEPSPVTAVATTPTTAVTTPVTSSPAPTKPETSVVSPSSGGSTPGSPEKSDEDEYWKSGEGEYGKPSGDRPGKSSEDSQCSNPGKPQEPTESGKPSSPPRPPRSLSTDKPPLPPAVPPPSPPMASPESVGPSTDGPDKSDWDWHRH